MYYLVCGICGEDHDIKHCTFLSDIHYVSDEPVKSRARQTIPNNLKIKNMADGSATIITKEILTNGTTFGPLYAKKSNTMNPLTNFPLKIFQENSSDIYYLDCTNEDCCNWMCFISFATSADDQNLICYQVGQDIFYSAIRTILVGEELKVWYAPYYAFKMNISLYNKNLTKTNAYSVITDENPNKIECTTTQLNFSKENITQDIVKRLSAQRLGAVDEKELWTCKMCSEKLESVVLYAKHLMNHYKLLLEVLCNICNKRFNSESILERHKKTKHSNSSSIINNVNNETTSILKNSMDKVESEISLNESVDKRNRSNEMQILNTNDINITNNSNVTEVKIDKDNVLTRVMEETISNSNDNQTSNNFACDICNKAFDKLDYLYRHLRKHTGEFVCTICLMVFARKENLTSHSCFCQNLNPDYECLYCQKTFFQKKYLKRHMTKHMETNKCKWCNHVFTLKNECNTHQCATPNHECIQCKKKFMHKVHLTRHMKRHTELPNTKKTLKRKQLNERFICEKCGEIFKSQCTFKQHLRSHGDKLFECDICHSKFHRIGVLKEHKTTHENIQVPCNICEKKLKSKKALDIHMLLHGNKKYHCDKCDRSFFQKCNYLKHYRQIHGDKMTYSCPHCPIQFTSKSSFDRHISCHIKVAQYFCSLCTKSFHKEYQLKRHVQASHSGITYRCPFCQMTARHRHSMRRHFVRRHSDLREEWDKLGFVNQLEEKPFILSEQEPASKPQFNDSQESNIGVKIKNSADSAQGQNITLQLPDIEQPTNVETSFSDVPQLSISESNESLTESVLRNTYIFDEGSGDIMFYILDNASVSTVY